ncbi:MAG: TadA family conjugal transfer-associated ATPase [Actinomycetota bacterium]
MTAPLLDRVRGRLVDSGDARSIRASAVADALRAEGVVLGSDGLLPLVAALHDDLRGLGPLQSLIRDAAVTDVLVNAGGDVWVDRGAGLQQVNGLHLAAPQAIRLAQRLAARAGRRIDEATPFVDARMPEGVRLHAVLPPICPRGAVISLRVPRRASFAFDELVATGTLTSSGADWIDAIVRARLSFLVTGATGSGKTTILGSILGRIQPDQRILVVEDSAELRPDHPHVVTLEARPANLEGAGQVTLRDLVRQALRMRPDRVVVGEVRGAEVVDLLAALNTGHEGGCGTVHANSPGDLPARIEALGLMAGLPHDAVHALAAAGLDVVIHVDRTPVGRRVSGVHVVRADGPFITAVPALAWSANGEVAGPGLADLAARLTARGADIPMRGNTR